MIFHVGKWTWQQKITNICIYSWKWDISIEINVILECKDAHPVWFYLSFLVASALPALKGKKTCIMLSIWGSNDSCIACCSSSKWRFAGEKMWNQKTPGQLEASTRGGAAGFCRCGAFCWGHLFCSLKWCSRWRRWDATNYTKDSSGRNKISCELFIKAFFHPNFVLK